MIENRLPPVLLTLIYEAAHKSFWRKDKFRNFLRRSGVPDVMLGAIPADAKKREVLDDIFPKLEVTESGQRVLSQLGRALAEQTSFPDLKNWENSIQMLADANEAVANLKEYLQRNDAEREREREAKQRRSRAEEQREFEASRRESLETLKSRFEELATTLLGTQEGGYAFEKWFYDLAQYSEIEHRRSYRGQDQRQIDGSITVDGTTYLVEMKFSASPSVVTDVDSFYKKVIGKADNTMGIMIAVSGFDNGAKANASGPRTPLLLIDAQHLYLVLGNQMSLKDVVARIRRHASQEGVAYLAAIEF